MRPNSIRISIGLGTFQRPQMLSNMLQSLSEMTIPNDVKPTLILADNDKEESARSIFNDFKDKLGFPGVYLVEEHRGIVNMRNAVLEKALDLRSDLIAFLDDDETVKPIWLEIMLQKMEEYDADVINGSVLRILPPDTPKWIHRGRFLKWESFRTGTIRKVASTSNVIFKKKLVDEWGLRFHPALNFAGASDTFLFRQAYLKGARIVWIDDAYVQEYFPKSRVNRDWILRRAFRRTNSKFIRKKLEYGYPRAAATQFFNGLLQLFGGLALSIITLPLGPMLRLHAQRIFVKGLGTFNGIFGGVYEEYRQTHGH